MFDNTDDCFNPEDCAEYIQEVLDPLMFNFLYKQPKNTVRACTYFVPFTHNLFQGARGIFQSDLILGVFSWHLRHITDSVMVFNNATGALALATAAVCCPSILS